MVLSFRKLTPFLGAEVTNLDLRAPIGPDAAAELRQALNSYSILLVREQPISAAEQVRFGEVFGDIDDRTINKFGRPQGERAHYVSNARPDGSLRTGELCFHNDQLFYDRPNRASILHGVQVPATGGETRFANVACVFESLPKALQQRLRGYTGLNIFDYAARGEGTSRVELSALPPDTLHWTHPVVFKHPHTGRETLWIALNNTIRIPELPKDESDALIEQMCRAVAASPFIYDHAWRVGDTMIWDNWLVQHARKDFDPLEPRTLRRVPVNARETVDA